MQDEIEIETDYDVDEPTRPDIPRLIIKESGEFVINTGERVNNNNNNEINEQKVS